MLFSPKHINSGVQLVPNHLRKRRLRGDPTAAFQYLKEAYREDGEGLSESVVVG